MSKINSRKDILLLLFYSPGLNESFNEPIEGKTRLVKMIFIFKMEIFNYFKKNIDLDVENFYEFISWNYGPFSWEIYDDLIFFLLTDFIEAVKSDNDMLPESAAEWDEWFSSIGFENEDSTDLYTEVKYQLTPTGTKYAKNIYDHLSETQKDILKSFKAKFLSLPPRAIIKYVYSKYPQFTDKSLIKEKYQD